MIFKRVLNRRNYPFSMDIFLATRRVLKNKVFGRRLIQKSIAPIQKIKTTTGKSNLEMQHTQVI